MLGVERLELPESVKPIQSVRSAGPVTRVRRDSENTSQVGFLEKATIKYFKSMSAGT